MPLAAGDKLGPFEILAPIGAGGMGEVYRARDSKLDRDVAIKVLPAALAQDPVRLARFEREAKVLASLNHPNIAQIYGIEDRALIMELVDGEIVKGPFPLEAALNYARQIADALEAAHEKGIVHRDLKPGNIMVTPAGVVKVLDFGLARVAEKSAGSSESSPTVTISATRAGVILGTAPYMSPEQARGKPVDKRADIWAFGVVLYEMLTGKRLFEGETVSDTLAQVLTKEPDWERVPVKVRRLLKKCLEKDPKSRLRDIGDAMPTLEEAPLAVPAKNAWLWPSIATALLVALGFVSLLYFREKSPVSREPIRFQIRAPEKETFSAPILSPDGRRIAFRVRDGDGRDYLGVREMGDLDMRRVAEFGDATPSPPFWSPDSRSLAFQSQGKLKRVSVAGGPVQVLCDAPVTYADGAWNSDGVIVFGGDGSPLFRVSASGGASSPITTLDPARDERGNPSFLPDGRHFVYTRISRHAEKTGVYLGSLDARPEAQESTLLMAHQLGAMYVNSTGSKAGYLLFLRQTWLMAQKFDPDAARLMGEPFEVGGPVGAGHFGWFSASATGALAWRGPANQGTNQGPRLTWFDRHGKMLSVVGGPGLNSFNTISLSRDGGRVAGDIGPYLWAIQYSRQLTSQLTFGPSASNSPTWSPDGSQIAYMSTLRGVYRKASSGAGPEETVFKSDQPTFPDDWSRDGQFLLFSSVDPKTKSDLWALPLSTGGAAAGNPIPFLRTEAWESEGVFSPDTRWVAYQSDESGMTEVYVRPFPAANGQWQLSHGGGFQPRWRGDGKELFYLSGDGKLMAVDISTNPSFQPGVPRELFQTRILGGGPTQNSHRWDVTPDGQSFLINSVTPELDSPPATVVLNWEDGLKE